MTRAFCIQILVDVVFLSSMEYSSQLLFGCCIEFPCQTHCIYCFCQTIKQEETLLSSCFPCALFVALGLLINTEPSKEKEDPPHVLSCFRKGLLPSANVNNYAVGDLYLYITQFIVGVYRYCIYFVGIHNWFKIINISR